MIFLQYRGEGQPYLIVDAGGGTVDLVVHQKKMVQGRLRTKEVSQGSGDLCGGTYVDKAFLRWLQVKSTTPSPWRDAVLADNPRACKSFDEWKARFPKLFVNLMGEWEKQKRGTNDTTSVLSIAVKANLAQILTPVPDADIIPIEATDFRQFFEPTFHKICYLIDQQLEAQPAVKFIFTVGGYSSCAYLRAQLKTR